MMYFTFLFKYIYFVGKQLLRYKCQKWSWEWGFHVVFSAQGLGHIALLDYKRWGGTQIKPENIFYFSF